MVVIATIIERIVVLFMQYRVNTDNFLRAILNLVKNNQLERALKYCESTKLAVAKVCRAGLLKANRGAVEISTAIDEELMRVTPGLEKRIANLWSLANIATLIGLIGTIFGLIRSFSGLASISPEQKAAFLARGISEALNNTAVGLTIAVICMIGHLSLSGVSKKLVHDLETSAVTLENFLIQQGGEKK
jgi:biopolymer transport protein ExbB/TolQ